MGFNAHTYAVIIPGTVIVVVIAMHPAVTDAGQSFMTVT